MSKKWMMFLLVIGILGSCKSDRHVVSSKLLQKRKYTKGYHFAGGCITNDTRSFAGEGKQHSSIEPMRGALIEKGFFKLKVMSSDNDVHESIVSASVKQPSPLEVANETHRPLMEVPRSSEESAELDTNTREEFSALFGVLGLIAGIAGLLLGWYVSLLIGMILGGVAILMGVISVNFALTGDERLSGFGLGLASFLLGLFDLIVGYFLLSFYFP